MLWRLFTLRSTPVNFGQKIRTCGVCRVVSAGTSLRARIKEDRRFRSTGCPTEAFRSLGMGDSPQSKNAVSAAESNLTAQSVPSPATALVEVHGPLCLRNGYVVETHESGRELRIRLPTDSEMNDGPSCSKFVCRCEGSGDGERDDPPASDVIPESVLRYERQMRKIRAADRAGAPVTAEEHLRVLHEDDHIVVANKPSGVLCVPGVNANPSLLTLIHGTYGCESGVMDSMIVHRLDMDTSGLVVFARTDAALRGLHEAFRERRVDKSYEALLCGHVREGIEFASVDLPLQRDHRHPPFMRVSTPQSESEAADAVRDLRHAGWKKLVRKKPKPSQTRISVIGREMYKEKHPVTRVKLFPITGRTHQLRVHCAALGHPIVADPAYGIMGEAAPYGGFEDELLISKMAGPFFATLALQRDINSTVDAENRCMCLHAKELRFDHPITGRRMEFEAAPPF